MFLSFVVACVLVLICCECVCLRGKAVPVGIGSAMLFLNCLMKQFAICLNVVVILLLNALEVFSVGGGGGALLDRPCMLIPRKCVLYL